MSTVLPASFRDPAGCVFREEGRLYRQINAVYRPHYERLMASGLYEALTARNWLVRHRERDDMARPGAWRIIEPDEVPYISYPYEWCFSQLRDAARLTLDIQREAMKFGMCLKDASAYNIQFVDGAPVFIDTLSFEIYEEGRPWAAYRQFCQHFLAPLALISRVDHRLSGLLKCHIDGIDLDLASALLPRSTWLRFPLLAHIHLHARSQRAFSDAARRKPALAGARMSRLRLEGLISSLAGAVEGLTWQQPHTTWGDYYDDTNYSPEAMRHKEALIDGCLVRCTEALGGGRRIVADYGANTGRFSRRAAALGHLVLAHDIDYVAVERNYLDARERGERGILPLFLDLANPAPALGWANRERSSFLERQVVDIAMALALVHHLALGNNVPLPMIASLFAQACRYLVIEFVPKTDSQAQRLLAVREDIFPDYHEDGFEAAFAGSFEILEKHAVADSERSLYLLRRRG